MRTAGKSYGPWMGKSCAHVLHLTSLLHSRCNIARIYYLSRVVVCDLETLSLLSRTKLSARSLDVLNVDE